MTNGSKMSDDLYRVVTYQGDYLSRVVLYLLPVDTRRMNNLTALLKGRVKLA